MTEDEHLAEFGLWPSKEDLPAVRSVLEAETSRESAAQGKGDTLLMKLCCVQLFSSRSLSDVLLIWRAKAASFDAMCSIDVQLLCGAGLPQTKAYLSEQKSADAQAALVYLAECEESGDFADFSVESWARWWSGYYGDDPASGRNRAIT
jgi:hypothetical protein